MSYGAEQIVQSGNQPRYVRKGKAAKFCKKARHRWMRQKMKDAEFVPKYNRYQAGWFD